MNLLRMELFLITIICFLWLRCESMFIVKKKDDNSNDSMENMDFRINDKSLQIQNYGNSFFFEDIFYVTNINCTHINCPNPNFCINGKACACSNGYVNFKPHHYLLNQNYKFDQVFCTYQQKKRIPAALLEFFVTGMGHFYCGRVINGLFKIGISLSPFIVLIFICCLKVVKHENEAEGVIKILICYICFGCCAIIIWQILDVIAFLMGFYNDGYGIPLY